jgi:hypothetical protein
MRCVAGCWILCLGQGAIKYPKYPPTLADARGSGISGFCLRNNNNKNKKKKTAFNKGVLSRGFRRHLEPFFAR